MESIATVLFVDDEPKVLSGIALALTQAPYLMITAASGPEALKLLGQEMVDIVVADEQMPGIRGSDLLAAIAVTHPDIVRIMLTGHATVKAAIRAINDGKIFRFLEKPCPPRELQAVLAEAANTRAVARAGADILRIFQQQASLMHSSTVAPCNGHRRLNSEQSPGQALPQQRMGLTALELATLSSREREVAQLIVEGRRVKQIGALLFISPHTVRNHLKSIFQKLDVHSQDELIAKGNGLSP